VPARTELKVAFVRAALEQQHGGYGWRGSCGNLLMLEHGMLERLKEGGFEIHLESHAAAILGQDFPAALSDLEKVLLAVSVPITEIIGSGGGETKGTQRMRRAFDDAGWHKHIFEIRKIIDGVEREAISHEVDHVKEFEGHFEGKKLIGLEIEWNNKDPFFDRDLENFKRLHTEGAVSAGVIVTRGSSLHGAMWDFVNQFAREQGVQSFADLERLNIQLTPRKRRDIQKRVERKIKPIDFAEAWADNFVSDKYGEATTHWKKLMDRISRGVGNPCPLLLIGLPASIVTFDVGKDADVGTAIQNAAEDPG
jgi:Restriction endonuclease BglII